MAETTQTSEITEQPRASLIDAIATVARKIYDPLRCTIKECERDEGQILFDIPLQPSLVDDKYLRDGFICTRWYDCKHCGKHLGTENVEVTDEAVEEYHDWFESMYGIRPDS